MEPLEPIQLVEEPAEEPIFGGYDFMFVDELSPGQICSICLVAMRNPVQTPCGHRFCEECLVGTFGQGNGRVCPQDRNPIPDTMGFFRDVAWEREILSLRVKCTMNDRGCTWIGLLRHYEGHYDSCLYEDVVCEDCKEEMQRRFLEDHMALECQNRIVQCEHCKEQFEFWRTQAHEGEECIRFPLECPQQCGVQEIPREEVEVHVRDDCVMTPVACPYEGAGCAFNDKRMNLKAHIEESTEDHLHKTWKELIKTKGETPEGEEWTAYPQQWEVQEMPEEKTDEGKEWTAFPFECPQKWEVQEIPEEEWYVRKPLSGVPLKERGPQSDVTSTKFYFVDCRSAMKELAVSKAYLKKCLFESETKD